MGCSVQENEIKFPIDVSHTSQSNSEARVLPTPLKSGITLSPICFPCHPIWKANSSTCFANHRTDKTGRVHWQSSGPTLQLKRGPLEHIPQDCVQTAYEYLQGRRLAVCPVLSAVPGLGQHAWAGCLARGYALERDAELRQPAPITGTDFLLTLSPVQVQPTPTLL